MENAQLSPLRKGRVTASVAGAILGSDPNKTKADVMLRMVQEYLGIDPPKDQYLEDVIFAYGKRNEPIAIESLCLEHNLKYTPGEFHAYEDWLGATPDGTVTDRLCGRWNLEVKCPYKFRKCNSDDKPKWQTIKEQMHYYSQVQIEMFCSGIHQTIFYQWSPAESAKLECVYYNTEFIETALPLLKEFHDAYLGIVSSPASAEQYLRERGRQSVSDDDVAMAVDVYFARKQQIYRLTQENEHALEHIIKLCGGRNTSIGDRKLTRVVRTGSVQYAKVVKDLLPDADLSCYTGAPTEYWKLS